MSPFFDAIARRGEGVLMLLGRLLVGALFVPSGFGKLTGIGGPGLNAFAGVLGGKGLPVPLAWAAVGALIEFFAGLAVVLGLWTRAAAFLMVFFTIAAALLSHNYWAMADAARAANYIQFWKNMAIVGGFLFLFVHGPGPLSLDGRR
jgi:putative oxidoreductase